MAQRRQIRRRVRRARPKVRRAPSPSAAGIRTEAKQSLSGDGGLMIGGVHDPAEKAADRMADRVMRMPASEPIVHRKCEGCEDEEKKARRMPEEPDKEEIVQTKPVSKPAAVAPGVGAVAASPGAATAIRSMGTGKPLTRTERAFFEPRFGADLSSVRIHDGPAADKASRGIDARAFTLGKDIAFARGEYTPGAPSGRRLMAHELAHMAQQRGELRTRGQRTIRRTPDCKNEAAVKKVIAANPRKYPAGVTMEIFKIDKEKNLGDVAKKFEKENKVKNAHELALELVKLNKKKWVRKGKCVIAIKGWVSTGWTAKEKRVNCAERIAGFKTAKATRSYTDWVEIKVEKKDDSYPKIVVRAEKEKPGLVGEGRRGVYEDLVRKLNHPWIKALNEGECVALPVGWKDRNIGSIPDEVKALNKASAKARRIDVIATIYAEQSHSSKDATINKRLDKQREYIYYSMLLRVKLSKFPAKLKDVITSGTYHGRRPKKGKGTYRDNYLPAKEYLEKGTTKKPLNVAAVKDIRALVGKKKPKPPIDAGPYYFHWDPKETPTAETEYQKVKKAELKKGTGKKAASAKAEKSGATEQAKHLGATEPGAWLKKIAGRNKGKETERIGSIYIYK